MVSGSTLSMLAERLVLCPVRVYDATRRRFNYSLDEDIKYWVGMRGICVLDNLREGTVNGEGSISEAHIFVCISIKAYIIMTIHRQCQQLFMVVTQGCGIGIVHSLINS